MSVPLMNIRLGKKVTCPAYNIKGMLGRNKGIYYIFYHKGIEKFTLDNDTVPVKCSAQSNNLLKKVGT